MRIVLTAALVLASGCASPPAPPPPHAFAEPAPELGIPSAARMAEGIYRGAQPDGAGLRRLRDLGFRTIINLRSFHSERREAETLGLRVVEIPMRADIDNDPPTDAQVRLFLDTVLDPANRPVFFHCAQGKDRTGVMAAVYRMEVDGWTNADALAEMHRFSYHPFLGDLGDFVREYRPRVTPR